MAPDVVVPANKAHLTAQLDAVRTLKATAESERQEAALEAAEADVVAKLERFRRVVFELKGYETASQVFVAGEFNSWSPVTTPLVRRGSRWLTEVDVEPGRQPYKFIVDGEWILDPSNRDTDRDGAHVNSVRTVY